MNVWFIDDREENRRAWLASFPPTVHETCTLRAFRAVPELFAALDAGARPDVVFVDFFIREHLGVEVIGRLLEGGSNGPLIIAHSSMKAANDGMVRAGAHFSMEKVRGAPKTRSIEEAVRSPEHLRQMIREHVG